MALVSPCVRRKILLLNSWRGYRRIVIPGLIFANLFLLDAGTLTFVTECDQPLDRLPFLITDLASGRVERGILPFRSNRSGNGIWKVLIDHPIVLTEW